MKGWLSYTVAFACAAGVAVMAYRAGFTALMTGAGWGMVGFFLLAILMPMLAGLLSFGVVYRVVAGRTFGAKGWAFGIIFVALATAAWLGLVLGDILRERVATILLAVVLFIGGRAMVARSANA